MSAIIGIIKPFVIENGPEFGVMATIAVAKNEMNAAMNQARRHYCTRVIPRGGRAVLAMRTSTEGRILDKHTKQDDGHFINTHVTCDCGGEFVADKHGEYVCNNCGIINAFENNYVDESSEPKDDDEAVEDENAEQDIEDHHETYEPEDAYLGRKSGERALEARLAAHQDAWKASKTSRPADEQYAKFLAKERKARHDEVMKANRTGAQKLLYEAKWAEARRQYRVYRILNLIKTGIQEAKVIRETLGMPKKTFYADIKDMTENGRITSETAGRATTLTLVDKAVPARRVPVRKTEQSFKDIVITRHTEMPTSYTWKNYTGFTSQ